MLDAPLTKNAFHHILTNVNRWARIGTLGNNNNSEGNMMSCNETSSESEKSKQCPCKCGKGIAAILVLFLLAGIACWYIHHPNRPSVYSSGPRPGASCTVYLSTGASVGGTVITANRGVINLQRQDGYFDRVQIPRSSILYVEWRATTDQP